MIRSLNFKKYISEVFLAVALWLNFFQSFFVFADVPEKYQMTFQDPATPVMEALIDFHHDLMFILIVIGCLVFWLVYRTFFIFDMLKINRQLVPVEMRVKLILAGVRFGPNKNLVTILRFNKNKYLEIIWTVVPFLTILTIMPASFALLYSMDDLVRPSVTIKCIGNQWFWNYNIADTRKVLYGEDNSNNNIDSLYSNYVQLLESNTFNYRFAKRFFPFLEFSLNKNQKNMLNYVIDNNIVKKDEMLLNINNTKAYINSVLDFLDDPFLNRTFKVLNDLENDYNRFFDSNGSTTVAWDIQNDVRFFALTNQIFFKAFFDFFEYFERKDFCLSCSLVYIDRTKIRDTAFFSKNFFSTGRNFFYDEFFKFLNFDDFYNNKIFDPFFDPFYSINDVDFFSFGMFDFFRARLIDFDLFFNLINERSEIFFSAFRLLKTSPVFADFDQEDIELFSEIIGKAWFSYFDLFFDTLFSLNVSDKPFQTLYTQPVEESIESVASYLSNNDEVEDIKVILQLYDDFYGQDMSNSKEVIADFITHLDQLFANFFSIKDTCSTSFVLSKETIFDFNLDTFLDTVKLYLIQLRYTHLDKFVKVLVFMDTNIVIDWFFDLNTMILSYLKSQLESESKFISSANDEQILEKAKLIKGLENVQALYLVTLLNFVELDHVFNEFKQTLSENYSILYELYFYLFVLRLKDYRDTVEGFFLQSFESFSAGILSNDQPSLNFIYSDSSYDIVQNYLNFKKLINSCFSSIKENFIEFFEDSLLIFDSDDLFFRFKIQKLNFDSIMVPEDDLLLGQHRLLDVEKNNILVVPSHTNIRLLITSRDVLHSWAVPSFGIKMDACPGRLNQVGLFVKRFGKFYGQCSEICGINHGFMPIVVKSVDPNSFLNWMENKKNMDIYFPESKSN